MVAWGCLLTPPIPIAGICKQLIVSVSHLMHNCPPGMWSPHAVASVSLWKLTVLGIIFCLGWSVSSPFSQSCWDLCPTACPFSHSADPAAVTSLGTTPASCTLQSICFLGSLQCLGSLFYCKDGLWSLVDTCVPSTMVASWPSYLAAESNQMQNEKSSHAMQS